MRNLTAGLLFPCCLPQVKALLSAVMLVSALFAATGCVVLDYSRSGNAQQIQAGLERLVASQDYHKALIYLGKIEPERDGDSYKSQYQRITLLIGEFETDVEQKAVSRAECKDLLEAVALVDQALKKIPESVKLLNLSDNLRQERNKRSAENDRNMLLSEAEYLFSQLKCYGEQARLEKPSAKTRWQRSRMEKSLAALHPDLLDCGQQAIKLAEYDVAEKCLEMAKKIDDSESVNQLLAQINDTIISDNDAIEEEVPIVLIAATKKSQPAAAMESSFLELEAELRLEIDRGELFKAYGSLAKLEKFPGKRKRLKAYRQQLDKSRESRIAKQLEEGASLYRRGKISEARSKWQKVLVLDPENQIAREKIVRADKVLKSIQDLQKAQQ